MLQISPRQGYKFSSREIKELARRFDGIFMPPSNEADTPIYFVEVQYQKKSDFWWRFMTEIFVYLGQYKPENDWLSIALFSNQKVNPGLPFQYQSLMDGGKIKIFYLDQLDISQTSSIGLEIISLIVGKDIEAIPKSQKAIQQTRKTINDIGEQTKILELIETVLVYKLKNVTREEIEAMFTFDELKETRYFQDVRAEAEQQGLQQGLQQGIQQGLQQGLQQGIQQGLQQGLQQEINLIIRQLRRKLGELPLNLETRLQSLSIETLENLGEALLDFNSNQDLIDWLNSY